MDLHIRKTLRTMETYIATELDQRERTAVASDPVMGPLLENPAFSEALERYRKRFYQQVQEGALGSILYGMGVLNRPFYQFLRNRLWPENPNLAASSPYWLHLVETAFRMPNRDGMDTLLAYQKWLDQIFLDKAPIACEQALLFEIANNSWFKKARHQKRRKLFAGFLVLAFAAERYRADEAGLARFFLNDLSDKIGDWARNPGDALNPLTLRNLAAAAVQFAAYAFPVLLQRFGKKDAAYIVRIQGFRLFEQWLYSRNRRFTLHLQEIRFLEAGEHRPLPTKPTFHWLPAIVLGNFDQVPYALAKHLCHGNPLRTAPGLCFPLNARTAHYFSQMPADTDWMAAFLTARVAVLGGYRALAQELNAHAYRLQHWQDEQFLSQTIEFFVRHEQRLPLNQVRPVLDYLDHCRTENPDFALKGRSPEALLRQMEAWHRDLVLSRQIEAMSKNWKPVPVNGLLYTDKSGQRYHIVQLCTAEALVAESRVLRHCVSSYANRCAQGLSSIWSLRREGDTPEQFERMVTIELNARRQVVQVRGLQNRMPDALETKIVDAWRRKTGLK